MAPLDLRNVPISVVSLPQEQARRAHITEHFSELGLQWMFSDGVTEFRKKKAVAKAQERAFRRHDTVPFLICEDDVELQWEDCVLPHVPADADIVYLATSQAGCLPGDSATIRTFGARAYAGFALAEDYDDVYVRLYSMISAIAILVLTERGRERFASEQIKAFRRDTPIDVRYAFAMGNLNTYAVRTPMFAERMDIQPPDKQSAERKAETHSPIPVGWENERRLGKNSVWWVDTRAVRAENTALEWHVENAWLRQFEKAERFGFVAFQGGLKVPASPYISQRMAEQIGTGIYKTDLWNAASAVVQPGEKVVDLTPGLGIVGGRLALQDPQNNVSLYESSAALVEHISKMREMNDLTNLVDLTHGIVTPCDKLTEAELEMLRTSYRDPGLTAVADGESTENGPAHMPWSALADQVEPDVLMLALTEGALSLWARADLSCLSAIVIDCRAPLSNITKFKDWVSRSGFEINHHVSRHGVLGARRSG